MKSKITFLLIAWAFFYGMAVAGGAAHRKTFKSTTSIVSSSNNAISELNVENR
ncbi:MAG: hypothetical protein JWP12_1983 [Bacteroidetes bacterium]|nr:hypothetical protein [Bacteroidota bacterium]